MSEKLKELLEMNAAPTAAAPPADVALSEHGRLYLRLFLGFLGVSALMAILVILGGKFGGFGIKVSQHTDHLAGEPVRHVLRQVWCAT